MGFSGESKWTSSSLNTTKFSEYANKLKTDTGFRKAATDKLLAGKTTDGNPVLVDLDADGVDIKDAEAVVDKFVGFVQDGKLTDSSTTPKPLTDEKMTSDNVESIYGGFNKSGWSNIKLIGKDINLTPNPEVKINVEKLIVFLNTDNQGNFQELTAAPPAVAPTPPAATPKPTVAPLNLDGVTFNDSNKAKWMEALIPETGKPGTAFELTITLADGTTTEQGTYKYADKTDQLQKEDTTTTPSTFKDVDVKDVPMELKQAKVRLIMAVDKATELKGKNLTSAFLSSEKLENADFTGANLTGAKLTGATLTNANFTNADLTSVVLAETLSSSGSLTVANLTGADLTGADLKDAKLQIDSKWYKITDTQIEIYDSSKSDWIPSTDTTTNLTVIDEFENIIKDAKNKDKATINGKNLTEVIDDLRKANTTAPATTSPATATTPTATTPTATTPATTSPATATATTPTSATTTSGEPIMGIARAKFGDLLTADQTYLKWEDGIALQTALNVKIIKGEIKINDGKTTPERLFVDGLFGEKSAMIAKAWLEKQPADKTLKDLLSTTSSPPATGVETLDKVGGTMLGLGSGGDEVTALQTQLKKQLKIDLTVDGIYGTQTEAAVTAFQKDWNNKYKKTEEQIYKISEDGVAGPQTRGALQSLKTV